MVFRYIFVFAIGFLLTFFLTVDFFNQDNVAFSLFFRAIFALFFVFIIWLLQPKKTLKGERNEK